MEEPVPSWLKVHLVVNDKAIELPIDPETILNCLDNECLKDHYQTYIAEHLDKNEPNKTIVKEVRGGIIIEYHIGEKKAYIIVHRADINPQQIIKQT